jgi:hypothetical protein
MDRETIIGSFLHRAREIGQLALVTDEELLQLLGEEVTATIATIERIGQDRRLCAACEGTCCSEIGCELYAPQFGRCPIHAYRPIACRLHFCSLFGAAHRAPIIELRDLFVGCVAALERGESGSAVLEIPPLAVACPRLVAVAAPHVEQVRLSRVDPTRAAEALSLLAAAQRAESIARRAR